MWLLLTAIATILLFWHLKRNHSYWKNKNVQFVKPILFFGNFLDSALYKKSMKDVYQSAYNQFPDEKYVGMFNMGRPELLIRDPELIKSILVKDFDHFYDRFFENVRLYEPLSANVINLTGERWKTLRKKLTPTFTTGKMKNMFYLMLEKGHELEKYLEANVGQEAEVELQEMFAKYTTDVIGTCAFGVSGDSMIDPESSFRNIGKEAFKDSPILNFKKALRIFSPKLSNLFRLRFISERAENFFIQIIAENISERQIKNIDRHDLIDLLLKERNMSKDMEIDEHFVAAQAFIFFLAGFETSSSLMAFLIYELALNSNVQEKLVSEINRVLQNNDGELSYENLAEMHYLEMVMDETLRKYPIGRLTRICTTPYKIPDSNVTIEKDICAVVSISSLHYDSKYYPEPEKFVPERFTAEEVQARHPMVYLPFGAGPHNCIGLRFGKLQSKVGLVSFLRQYSVEATTKTSKQIKCSPKSIVPNNIGVSSLVFNSYD
ncbi:cytochrome P450 6B7-like [Arctopsyche grandis]|uniref:cytochrome P450 6B7-like n=1 Tax=Arctopsyche grandis TaxID=121162 RepID=UPI00406D9378